MDSDSAIAVLTAMITPAVLISACGSMILSTSSRLGRVVDRVRFLSDRLENMPERNEHGEATTERQALIFQQLDKLTSRARLLQRCMVTFYLSLGMFVATSVAIGLVGFSGNPRHNLIPVGLGLAGACFLFYGSISADLRSASGAQHDSRGDGFHLAAIETSHARGDRRTTQATLRALQTS